MSSKEQEQLNKDFKEAILKLEQHARTSNEEVGKIQVCQESMKTDLEWLKRFFFIIATASVGSLVATLISIIIKWHS